MSNQKTNRYVETISELDFDFDYGTNSDLQMVYDGLEMSFKTVEELQEFEEIYYAEGVLN